MRMPTQKEMRVPMSRAAPCSSALSFGAGATIRVLGASEHRPWTASAGANIVGIDDDSVLWKTRLGEGAAQASGLGESRTLPNWALVDGVLNLLDSIELWDFAAKRGDSADISGYLPKPYLTSIGQAGNYVSASIGGIHRRR